MSNWCHRYRYAHKRVKKLRGPARDYACVDCGVDAADWSFSHYDDVPCRTSWGAAYSMNPDHYRPRCRPCHVKYDATNREGAAA